MASNDWWSWVQLHAGGETKREMAAKAEVDPSNLTRWASGKPPEAATAIAVGRALGRSPIEALQAAGYLTEEEAQLREVAAPVRDLDDAALLLELLRRHRQRVMRGEQPINQDSIAAIQAVAAAERILALPVFPTFSPFDDDEDEGGVDADAEMGHDPAASSGGMLRAARTGQSRGEAVRRAQDDDGESPDASS